MPLLTNWCTTKNMHIAATYWAFVGIPTRISTAPTRPRHVSNKFLWQQRRYNFLSFNPKFFHLQQLRIGIRMYSVLRSPEYRTFIASKYTTCTVLLYVCAFICLYGEKSPRATFKWLRGENSPRRISPFGTKSRPRRIAPRSKRPGLINRYFF